MSTENGIEKLVYQDKDGKEYEIYVEVNDPKIYSGEDHENDDPNDDGRERPIKSQISNSGNPERSN